MHAIAISVIFEESSLFNPIWQTKLLRINYYLIRLQVFGELA